VDSILLPDTFTHWTLVLIDDSNKTYRKLYALEPVVHLGRLGCVPNITLRTEIRNGELTAYVAEDYERERTRTSRQLHKKHRLT